MLNQQLLDYIKQQIQEGVDRVQIKNSLLANGWPESVVEEAFTSVPNISSQTQNLESSEKIISSLPGPVETLSQTLTLFKQRLGTFLGILLIVLLLGSTVLMASNFNAILVIPLFIVYWIIQIWGQTALLYAINGSQENIGILESYKRGWRKIFSIWWISFLVLFISIGGIFLFIIPGIIFALWFILAMVVLVAEDEKGMNALLKSREYVRGRELSVFWHLLFLSLISLVISFISAIISSHYSIFFEISSIVTPLILAPLSMTYLFHLYKNLKALRGEFTFIPTRKMKMMFVLVTIIGIIIPIILFSSIFFLSLHY